MEGPVVVLAIALFATALAAADRDPTTGRILVVGIASAALVLTRLDFAPILLVVAGALLLRWRSGRHLATWLVGVAVVGIPAAVWWLGSWGHVLSTSATVKNATVDSLVSKYGGRLTSGYAQYVVERAASYARGLSVWDSLADRSFLTVTVGAPAALAVLCGLVLLGLAAVGWLSTGRRALDRVAGRRSPGSDAWALWVVVSIVVAKAALDLIVAPIWASLWYSAPQRLLVAFVIGSGAWLGVRVVAGRSRVLAAIAVAALILLAIPLNADVWDGDLRPRPEGRWQDQLDLAVGWIADHGPSGRYGALDAGLVGYGLDGTRPVVNLDGLVNDYAFAELVVDEAPILERTRATGVDVFVNRLERDALAPLRSCGRVLWGSPESVPFRGERARVWVVDVRDCKG